MEAALIGIPEVLWLYNKMDLLATRLDLAEDALAVSAKTGAGMPALHARLLALAGGEATDGAFSARSRHVLALQQAQHWLEQAAQELQHEQLELAAEALAQAHQELGTIGGAIDADGLLGHIFSTFCIGK